MAIISLLADHLTAHTLNLSIDQSDKPHLKLAGRTKPWLTIMTQLLWEDELQVPV